MAETLINLEPLAIALAGGLLPALIWLWFWHRQDKECPEPTGLIVLSFVAGMVVVYFVFPLQKLIYTTMPQIWAFVNSLALQFNIPEISSDVVQITLWAFIEEFAKYATVFFIAFKSRHFNEPVDAIVYMLTAALGFTAMENALYILKDLAHTGTIDTVLNSNLRFIGATIAHTISSALVGIAIALSFYAPRFIKIFAITVGVLVATLLHAYFNLTIMDTNGTLSTLQVFSRFWIAMIVVIILIEFVKKVVTRTKTCPV
jgi:RsiW-degrading membrane proteinase PrsW (M82 family)